MARTVTILLLTAIGFAIAYATTRDPFVIAVGCWVLAIVYGLLTSTRRSDD